MVSDIYFPIPPSPYQAFYPISYPLNYYPTSPQRSLTPKASPCNSNTKLAKRHDHVYDANRNHIVPYYYSETLPCMPNNLYMPNNNNRNRQGLPYDDRNQRPKTNPRLQNSSISPELSKIFSKSNSSYAFRPFSVLETSTTSPMPKIQRPTSVVPMSDNFRPASVFFRETEVREKSKEVPEWKALLLKEPISEKPIRQICRIPNCKCQEKPANILTRFSESRTLPSLSTRSLDKVKNLSLPTLKLNEIDKLEKDDLEVQRDPNSKPKPVSENHLGFV